MEWSFKYIGPKTRIDERDCPLCSTVARKRCLAHQSQVVGCPHCDAVRDGVCAAHSGVESALSRHDVAVTDPANCKWVAVPGTAIGRTQERRETPMTAVKAARIAKAQAQFAAAGAYIAAQCALLPEICQVDVSARGDDLFDKLAEIEITIKVLGEEAEEPESDAEPVAVSA